MNKFILRGFYISLIYILLLQSMGLVWAEDVSLSSTKQIGDPIIAGERKMGSQIALKKIITNKLVIPTDFDEVHHVAWSPDSKYFAATVNTKTNFLVVVYNSKTYEIVKKLDVKKSGYYTGEEEQVYKGDVTFSPDGRYLAGGVGIVTLWDTKTWEPVKDILGPFSRGSNAAGAVNSISFSPDSQSLAIFYDSVVWPETVRVDDLKSALEIAKNKSVKHLASIMVFDVVTTHRLFAIKDIERTAELGGKFTANLAYTTNGKYLLSARVENHKLNAGEHYKYYTFLEFRNPQTGEIMKEISNVHIMRIETLAASFDSKYIATGTTTTDKEAIFNESTKQWDTINNQDPIRIWNVESGEKVMELGPLRGAVRALAFSPNNKVLVSCQTDKTSKETIWLWDVASGQLIERVNTPNSDSNFNSLAISPDGHIIAMPVDNKIYLISVQQN